MVRVISGVAGQICGRSPGSAVGRGFGRGLSLDGSSGLCRTPLVEWVMARKSRSKPASRSTLTGSRGRAAAAADCRVRQVDLDARVRFAYPSPAPIAGTSSSCAAGSSSASSPIATSSSGWSAVPAGSAGGSLTGHMEAGAAAAVWQVRRPGWTQAGWWDAEVRAEVRALLWLPVGRELQDHLIALTRADSVAGYARGHCPFDHTTASVEERVGVPGSPCACQVITVAAWAAVASWVSAWAIASWSTPQDPHRWRS